MSATNEKTQRDFKQIGNDLAVLLKQDCKIQRIKNTYVFTRRLEAEIALSITVTHGIYVVSVKQYEKTVFDMTYRPRSWVKVNAYSPDGTWRRIIKNKLAGQSNVVYPRIWFNC